MKKPVAFDALSVVFAYKSWNIQESEKVRRIKRQAVAIDANKVADFFEQRGVRFRKDAPYSSILYQDQNPQLAIERDRYEKEFITPQLHLTKRQRVLDIGCGIGRWAETLAEHADAYVGIDISPRLVDIARERIHYDNVEFLVGGATDIERADVANRGPFDLVIMSGIMIYLNDDALMECLQGLAKIVAPGGRIYMREPLAVQERLTLSNYWSEELQQHYSAIYRSADELEAAFRETLYKADFEPVQFASLYKNSEHNNRRETIQHFAIVRRL